MLAHGTQKTLDGYKKMSRQITGWIRCYSSNGDDTTGVYSDGLIDFTIESSAPKGKFFGFAASKKLTFNVLGNIVTGRGALVNPEIFQFGDEPMAELPFFYVDVYETADTKKTTTVTAYDGLTALAKKKKFNELQIGYPIKLGDFAEQLVESFGYTLIDDSGIVNLLDFTIKEGEINLNGDETVYDMLVAIAEITGTVCICSGKKGIKFKRIDTSTIDDTIDRAAYFNIGIRDAIRLSGVATTTPLGDNYLAGDDTAYVQHVVDNPLLTLRDDILSHTALMHDLVRTLRFVPYTFEGRGCPYYEIGDVLSIATNTSNVGYTDIVLFNETLTFNGGLRNTASWEAGEEEVVHTNPVTLGEALKHTTARVDKVNNEISLVASKASGNEEAISALRLNTDSISASVTNLKEATEGAIAGVNGDIGTLTKKVEATMTSEDVQLHIRNELSNGVDKVTTSTGFTFNEAGLTVSKTGSQMSTTIDEDGMSVYRDNTEVLTADNHGVIAYNLHAKTYLIIGENSRFEDYTNTNGEARTGCFWIGG